MLLTTLLSQPCSSRYAAIVSSRYNHLRTFSTTAQITQNKAAQPSTAATENITLTEPIAYISESTDPWFNLSYEDWLLRNTKVDTPVLFLYRNEKCVVIGRNQNPLKETSPRYLSEVGLPLVRRRSGGGTVYHDMGNTNFSIILPRLMFTRRHGAELVARAVGKHLGVGGCGVNDRNDIIVEGEGKEYKVSGSAYKIIQNRAYHHGTMLISSSLDTLGRALKSSSPNMETKGVASHPSPVTTLNAQLPKSSAITHESFSRAVCAEFAEVYGRSKGEMDVRYVRDGEVPEAKVWRGVDELKTWEWTFGQTPEFGNTIEGELSGGKVSVTITARHALITSAIIGLDPSSSKLSTYEARQLQSTLDALSLAMVGKRYETIENVKETGGPWAENIRSAQLADEILQWLRKAM